MSMIGFCIVLLTAVYSAISFTILLSKRMAVKYYFFIVGYLIIVNPIMEAFWGQWSTVPMILSISTIVCRGCSHSIMDVALSLTGYVIALLVKNIIYMLLEFHGISMDRIPIQYSLPLILAIILTASLLLILIKKFFLQARLYYLQICPKHLQKLFLTQILLGICLLIAHFLYDDFAVYPLKILLFNSIMIAAFVLCSIHLFFSIYQVFQNNYELSMQKRELSVMQDYMDSMEKFYDDIRIFRHDYKNLISTLQHYIDADDSAGLKAYFTENILPDQEVLSNNGFTIGKLHQIKIPPLKSILYTKILAAYNKNIDLILELEDPIENAGMDTMNLCRVLGILFDNSIEAAAATQEKILKIFIIATPECLVFTLVNSTPPMDVPLSSLMEKGVTTKTGHDGLGLYIVYNIVKSLENVSYSLKKDSMFHQTLEIRKEV